MSSRIFLIISIIFALIQGPLLPLIFAEGFLLIFYLWSNNFTKNLFWPFMAGIIFDLIQDEHLGTTSLLFLITAWILKNLKTSLPLQRPSVLVGLVVVVNLIRSYLLIGSVSIFPLVFLSLISYLFFHIIWGDRKEIRIG